MGQEKSPKKALGAGGERCVRRLCELIVPSLTEVVRGGVGDEIRGTGDRRTRVNETPDCRIRHACFSAMSAHGDVS